MLPVVILVGVGLAVLLAQRKDKTLTLSDGDSHIEVVNAGEILYNKIHTRLPMQDWGALPGDDRAAIQGFVHGAMVAIQTGQESLRDVADAIAGPIVDVGTANDPSGSVRQNFVLDQNLRNNVVADVRHTLATLTGSV